MTADVRLGENSVKLCGNAATAVRYKQVFHNDLLMSFKGMSAEDFDVDVVKQLAFIMFKQSETADFKQVTFEDYIEWLEQYEETDILNAAADIISCWLQNTKTLTKAKKK